MRFSFHLGVGAELDQAIDWYEGIEPGLGLDFAMELRDAIGRALLFPGGWTAIAPVRRSLLKRFPDGVLDAEEPEGIHVPAGMHLRRCPGYCKGRQ